MQPFISMERFVILENVRSAHNVGSIFRTADGAGVTKLFLVGYTPAPIDRFGREQPEIKKTSLGASSLLPWEAVADIEICIDVLRRRGTLIVAVEQDRESIDYRELEIEQPIAFIVGNEVDGVSSVARSAADHVVSIPMHGTKESLNVSVATGIVLFASLKRVV